MRGTEFRGLTKADGPIVIAAKTENVGFSELVRIRDRYGVLRVGKVVDLSENAVAIQLFSDNSGISLEDSWVEYLAKPLEFRVGEDIVGRIFDGLGRPIDGYPDIPSSDLRDINGLPINPSARIYPRDFIQTGISAIDGMNTLIRGQKLPIFSGNGLPHNRLAAQIIRQAKVRGGEAQFAVVFAGMGIKYDVARYFIDSFELSGVLSRVVMFLSLADSPSIERLLTPRSALTAAEYLAYEKGMHVLVVLTDMTNYCEALREVSAARNEVPSRKGYPGYLYSDLASLYERAGRIEGSEGSITQLPILSMPNDDISHPIPDLTGLYHRRTDRSRKGFIPARYISPYRGTSLPVETHERRHRRGHDEGGPQGSFLPAFFSLRLCALGPRPRCHHRRGRARRTGQGVPGIRGKIRKRIPRPGGIRRQER